MEDFEKPAPRASSEPGGRTPRDRPDLEATSDPPSGPDSEVTRTVGPDSEVTRTLGLEGIRTVGPESEATQTFGAEKMGSPAVAPRGVGGATVRWGSFELIEKVGEGGFGETFRARDTRLEREIALKLLKPAASRDETISGCVIREGAMLARVRHPNVVIVYGAERMEGRIGLWMEFVRGRTLENVLGMEGPLNAHDATAIGIDLCFALAAVHGAGIIHRDIKADNVMKEEGGRIVLMDFGAGLDLQKDEPSGGSMTGTPLYMAPELFRGEAASLRSDIYSLGVLLYHLVTGEYPVTARSMRELREGHEGGRRRRLGEVRAGLPEQFVRVVERCLSHESRGRYDGAGALEAALISAVADLTAYRRARIAEWSQPRYRIDKEFVALSLLVDQGEEAAAGRWSARPERYLDLGELMAAVEDPVLVVLGPPGSGKSTLLTVVGHGGGEAVAAW